MKRGGHKTVSPAQLAANRRNARKSTGPRTANGKAVSKLNALKHGVLAQTVLVRGRQCKESPREFKKFCAAFYADLAPAGAMEEMLADQIIQAAWRLRRARTAESGEIALSVDGGGWRRQCSHNKFTVMLWEGEEDPMLAMRDSAFGNVFMRRQLEAVRESVEAQGELTEAAVQAVVFRGKPYRLTRDLEELRLKLQQNPGGLPDTEWRAKQKQQALDYLRRETNLVSWRETQCEEREEMEEQARQAAAVLPADATLEKILRYEAALERQLYRAMNQLERLQRRRLGENIPAPMTLDVSAKG